MQAIPEPRKRRSAAPLLHDVHAQAYDVRAHQEALHMREISPKYLVESGKEVGRPPFPYKHPWQGRYIPGGANVCPGGQYFDNPSLGNFDDEAMLATTNRSFNTEHLERTPTASPCTQQAQRVGNTFRTTYAEKHCWPVMQARPSTAASAAGALTARRAELPDAKVTLGPPFSVYRPSTEARANLPRHYEPYCEDLPGKDGSIPCQDAHEDAAEPSLNITEDQGISTKYYGEGTGFGVNYEPLAQTRTTKGLRGNAWTSDEFADTFRTTYSDMLVTGFSTTRARPGSATRVHRTSWDRNRPRGLKQP